MKPAFLPAFFVQAFWLIAATLFLADRGFAGEFNPTRNVGDDAPGWSELTGVDDQQHAMADLKESDVVIVVFTCNSCPYAVDVEDRLNDLVKKYAEQKVSLVAINVHLQEEELLPAMKQRTEQKQFGFIYLHDATQRTARDYGATRTPEFFVLNKERKIIYMGALDDSPDGKNVTKRYVESAVDAALAEKLPELGETIAIGCGIRFKRERK
jgi:peroxiredoxin